MTATKILAISSSPHREGNSATMLTTACDAACQAGAEVEIIYLNDYKLEPCIGCCGCCKSGVCVLQDDYNYLNEKMRNAHRIIIATPIFFGSVCAQLKILIDRTQTFWAEKYLLKRKIGPEGIHRKGLMLSCSALHKEEFFKNARQIIHLCFHCQDIDDYDMVTEMGVEHEGDIKEHAEVLERCKKAGTELAL